MDNHAVKTHSGKIIQDPPLARLLFGDTRLAGLWLVVRVLLGLGWLDAALHKLFDPNWMLTGVALQRFWENAVVVPDGGRAPITFDWYRAFIQGLLDSGTYVWFAKFVAVTELLVGAALIVGAFVGIAAFLGAFLNWNFIMAGASGANGLFGFGALLLILAWKTAGYYGLDYFLLPWLGTPWTQAARQPETQGDTAPRAAGGD